MQPEDIRSMRMDLRMSRSAFARKVGLSGKHGGCNVKRWEEGINRPSITSMKRIKELQEYTYLELRFRDSDIEKIKAAANEVNMSLNEFITKRVKGEI